MNGYKIEVLQNNNVINIYVKEKKYINKEIDILIFDDNHNEINKSSAIINNDIYFWYKHSSPLLNYKWIEIEIYLQLSLVYKERIRFKDNHNNLFKKQCLHINNIGGMGDQFSAEPIIRKLSNSYEQKITVFTVFPELFENHPNVEKVIHSEKIPKKYFTDEYEIHYILRYEENSNGFKTRWPSIDFRQMMAYQLGFMLTPDEMQYKFYPNDFEEIEELPDRYVLINPSITGIDRNWSMENWQKLVNILNENDINVVSIGKKDNYNGKNLDFMSLNIKKGIDLSGKKCQSNLSQVWHIISKSKLFITMDNGLFIFAGSTDTNILQLGSAINPYYHKPYRNGSQNYKYTYVIGSCNLHCLSDLKYGTIEQGTIKNNLIQYCYKGYPDYKCHPTAEKVAEKSIELIC